MRAAFPGWLLSGLLLSMTAIAQAQGPMPPSAAQLEAMKKVEWLVGQWSGKASIEAGPERRIEVTQTENVQSKLDGLVLVIEGIGRMKPPGREEEVPVFKALAVISYDERAKRYRWHAYTAGHFADAEAKVSDGVVEWRLPNTPMGSVRYTIKRTDAGAWHEIGESSRDGKSWQKFFEMTLQRAK